MRLPQLICLIALFIWPVGSTAQAGHNHLSDNKIREIIVRESRAAYYALGVLCACPDELDGNGNECDGRSVYSTASGKAPKCYVTNVSRDAIRAYRERLR